ncbi:MAG: EamA/RhaT family transporter, partial [Terracidiphilus sp.]
STAVASEREHASTDAALQRECARFGLDYGGVLRAYSGDGPGARENRRGWIDYAIIAAAAAVFVYLAWNARAPALAMNFRWVWALGVVLALSAAACAWKLARPGRTAVE